MNYIVDSDDLTSVANAIRTKGGTSASLAFPAEFVSAIAAIPTGGGKLETGTFTIASDTKTVTINHSLGVVPDFCIVYPINVPTATKTYRIAWQVILRDIGQADYNISTYSATYNARHMMAQGAGYSLSANPGASAFHNITRSGYAGDATTTTFTVGGANEAGSGLTISAGEYGYILGVVS